MSIPAATGKGAFRRTATRSCAPAATRNSRLMQFGRLSGGSRGDGPYSPGLAHPDDGGCDGVDGISAEVSGLDTDGVFEPRAGAGGVRDLWSRIVFGGAANVGIRCKDGAWERAVAGCLGAAGVTRALEGLLFEVSRFDFVTFATMAGILVAVSLFASWLPALRYE